VVVSDLAIRLRKVLAAFGTRGGGVKVRLLIGRERFHALGIGHDFTDYLVFVQYVLVEVVHVVFPAVYDRRGLILFVLGYAITRESTHLMQFNDWRGFGVSIRVDRQQKRFKVAHEIEGKTKPSRLVSKFCNAVVGVRVFHVLGRVTLAVWFVVLEGFLFVKPMETGETNVCFMSISCSSAYESRHVPYAHVMFPLVLFQQQEVHSVRAIGVLADVQRGESALVTYAKHVYTYTFVHVFEFGNVSHVERKSEPVCVKSIFVLSIVTQAVG